MFKYINQKLAGDNAIHFDSGSLDLPRGVDLSITIRAPVLTLPISKLALTSSLIVFSLKTFILLHIIGREKIGQDILAAQAVPGLSQLRLEYDKNRRHRNNMRSLLSSSHRMVSSSSMVTLKQ